jgi:nucleotide-binding universal stress UspA family protein
MIQGECDYRRELRFNADNLFKENPMATRIIVSYDDTDNDRDALAFGRLLAFSGADLSLAYVRHSQGGALEEKEAEDLLARGAESVGAPDMPRHVVVNPGTSVGLAELAERENADVIVFGSEYRTAPGTVKPGIPAHKLLLGGPAAIAVAPAGLRDNPSVSINTIGVIDEGDPAARQTAESLAAALGATVAERAGAGHIDLLVVGSRPESPAGKVTLSAASDYAVETASFPVLVVPRGRPVEFSSASPGSPSNPDESAGPAEPAVA